MKKAKRRCNDMIMRRRARAIFLLDNDIVFQTMNLELRSRKFYL